MNNIHPSQKVNLLFLRRAIRAVTVKVLQGTTTWIFFVSVSMWNPNSLLQNRRWQLHFPLTTT